MAGKIQNEDLKTLAELTGAGGAMAQLPNDSKIYVASLTKQLSTAITDKDFVKNPRTINAQVGTSYTFVLADGSAGGAFPLVTASNVAAQTYTVPNNSSVAFPVGTQIDLIQLGSGQVSIAAAGGVTIGSKSGFLKVAAQYVGVTLIKTGTNSWVLLGDLVA